MDEIGVKSGAPTFIEEILEESMNTDLEGHSVCVIGRLSDHDVDSCSARVTDPLSKQDLVVDTSLIEPFGARYGSLFQFIGELVTGEQDGSSGVTLNGGSSVVLKARVVRCVDGIDMTMYRKAIMLQRDFLNRKT
ncbi:uncharacterized protein LOC128213164 [Mya arenaria]|uniref:uncharacterized protein LOC128213164 n=1 Tax=Mya arenaria TaxID=6604 RepID=UPI0022DF24DA|nr:uncharacterized protein LOC128213164 [Mya arenaria]